MFAPKLNLGLELLVGNNEFADGQYWAPFHTSQSPNELSLYRKLGEAAYGDDCMHRARTWIRENPERFRELTALRARHFWIGTVRPPELLLGSGAPPDWKGLIKWWAYAVMGVLGLLGALCWRGAAGSRWLVTGVVLTYPLVYLVTHATGRYRLPLEPLLTLTAVALVLSVGERLLRRGPGRGARVRGRGAFARRGLVLFVLGGRARGGVPREGQLGTTRDVGLREDGLHVRLLEGQALAEEVHQHRGGHVVRQVQELGVPLLHRAPQGSSRVRASAGVGSTSTRGHSAP